MTDRAIDMLSEILLKFEGEFLKPYRCPAGIPTIGVGATTYPDGRPVTMKDPSITQEQSRDMLRRECIIYLNKVDELLTREATEEQLVAMASLAYNIGINAFKRSTVLRAHNSGQTDAASRAFHLWNKAKVNGKLTPLKGLTARRAAESALYLSVQSSPFPEPSVQAVAPESKLVASPINAAGVTGVTTGVATLGASLLGDAMPVIRQAKEAAEAIGVQPLVLLGIVALTAGLVTTYYRWKQRHEGWS